MNELSGAISNKASTATLWGVITLVLGLLAICSPFVTGLAVAVMIGGLLFLAGISQTLYAFQAESLGKGVLRFLFGGITALAGLYVVVQPGLALAGLAAFLAIYFLVDGAFALVAAFGVQENRTWFIVNGLVTLALGWMLWKGWPLSGALAIGILVGIRLVMSGVLMLALGSAGRKAARRIGAAG